MIIGLVGNLGVGKDYITENIIIPYFGKEKCQIISMADSLKVELMVHMSIDFDRLYIKKDKDSRKLLQVYGTDIMRRKHGYDIWIKYVDAWVKVHKSRGKEIIIIPDIRFQDEADYIKNNNGLLLKIEAKDRSNEKINEENLKNEVKHKSETSISVIMCDFIINNSKENKENVKDDIYKVLLQY
jgi:hypothetical protein